jgi:hypothetical protein
MTADDKRRWGSPETALRCAGLMTPTGGNPVGVFLYVRDQVDAGKRDVTEKFSGYFRLLDACARSGCPVCWLVEADGRRYLEALNAASGAAILYEDLVRVSLGRIRRMRDGTATFVTRALSRLFTRRRRPTLVELRRRRRACPACAWVAEAEVRYLATLTRFVDDPQLARAHAKSDGLCAPHLLAAVELSSGTAELGRLLDLTMLKWDALRRDLDGFVAKHDYRNRIPFTEAEATSYRRAFETVAGRRGVWGSDLHDREAAIRPTRRQTPLPAPSVVAEAEIAVATRTIADLRAENEQLRGELAAARDAARDRSRREP